MIWYLLLLLLLAATAYVWYYHRHPMYGVVPDRDMRSSYEEVPNFRRGRFHNSEFTKVDTSWRTLLDGLLEYLRSRDLRPRAPLRTVKHTLGRIDTSEAEAYVTWFGHSALRLETNGQTLLIDPMIGPWVGPIPFLGSRFPVDYRLKGSDLGAIDAVLITHDHFDHLDYASIQMLRPFVDRYIVPLGVGAHLLAWGIPADRITEMAWGDTTWQGPLDIHFTPARHFGGRTFASRKRSLWGSFVLQAPRHRLYFGGDSGYGNHFKEIGDRFGPFDLTTLDCGQYHPLWKSVHMTPEEALLAHADLRGKLLLPIHWGGFSLSTHPWYEPAERLLSALQSADASTCVITPRLHERFSLANAATRCRTTWWRRDSPTPATKR